MTSPQNSRAQTITPENATAIIGEVMLPDVYPIVVDLERSLGNQLYDSKGKRFYLDCFSYIASNPVGHNHPAMHDPEFEKRLLRVARTKPSNSDFHTVELAEFVSTFRQHAMPSGFRYLFCVEGGAGAVENAMKVAFDWKVRLNQGRGRTGETGRQILHFKQAFHGRLGYTLSTTNTADPRKTKFYPKFDWPRLTNPRLEFPLTAERLAAAEAAEKHAVREIEAACKAHENDIAALIIEPIQAEGGDNHFRPEFHRELRALADKHEFMLIYDEVQTGCGLTGRMWAYEHYGIEPDIICFGKKFQVCGIVVGPRVDLVENHVFREASRINSTWGGNLTDMVRCARYLEIIAAEKLIENAATVGSHLVRSLEGLAERFPSLFSNPRGKGLMAAMDVVSPVLRQQILEEVFRRGALILKCGERSLRFRPSLNFTAADVDTLTGILADAAEFLLRSTTSVIGEGA